MQDTRTLRQRRSAAYRKGVVVMVVLAILTAIEFYFGLEFPSITILAVLALIKGALIVQHYMHISTIFSEEESH